MSAAPGTAAWNRQGPAPVGESIAGLARCIVMTHRLLWGRHLHLPAERVGTQVTFADGTSTTVFRETTTDHRPIDPCVLVVTFRLRCIRGRGHTAFEHESLLNTVLFAGFRGLVSKWWLAADEHGRYRGLYEWDGPEQAAAYARCLWRVLALVSVRGSIAFHVIAGIGRDQLVDDAGQGSRPGATPDWWQVAAVSAPTTTVPGWTAPASVGRS